MILLSVVTQAMSVCVCASAYYVVKLPLEFQRLLHFASLFLSSTFIMIPFSEIII